MTRVSPAARRLAALRVLHPEQWRAEVASAIRAHPDIGAAARALGVARRTLGAWVASDPAVADGVPLLRRGRPRRRG